MTHSLLAVLVLQSRDVSRQFASLESANQRNLIRLGRTHFGGFGHSTEYLVQDKFVSQGFLWRLETSYDKLPLRSLSDALLDSSRSGHRRVYRSAEYLGDVKFCTSHCGSVQA